MDLLLSMLHVCKGVVHAFAMSRVPGEELLRYSICVACDCGKAFASDKRCRGMLKRGAVEPALQLTWQLPTHGVSMSSAPR